MKHHRLYHTSPVSEPRCSRQGSLGLWGIMASTLQSVPTVCSELTCSDVLPYSQKALPWFLGNFLLSGVQKLFAFENFSDSHIQLYKKLRLQPIV